MLAGMVSFPEEAALVLESDRPEVKALLIRKDIAGLHVLASVLLEKEEVERGAALLMLADRLSS
jgi:hypothetical protein